MRYVMNPFRHYEFLIYFEDVMYALHNNYYWNREEYKCKSFIVLEFLMFASAIKWPAMSEQNTVLNIRSALRLRSGHSTLVNLTISCESNGTRERDRTSDLKFRKLPLYPLSYPGILRTHKKITWCLRLILKGCSSLRKYSHISNMQRLPCLEHQPNIFA